MVCLPIVVPSSRLRLHIHLTFIIVQLYCVRVHHIAMIITDGNPEVVLPIVSTATHRAGQDLGLGVLRVDVTLQLPFVVESFVTM